MKKKVFKGFTLIELLATILILGIIALITTIVVGGIIKDSKKSGVTLSVKSYIATINDNILSAKLRDESINDGTYKILANGNLCIGTYSNSQCVGEVLDLNIDRGIPTSGEVVITDRKVTKVLNASINGETISYDAVKNKEIISEAVLISNFEAIRYINSIKINFNAVNANSYTCEYGLTENYGSEGIVNAAKTECIINDLTPGTLYYYKLTVSGSGNKSDSKKGAIVTLPLKVNPTIALSPNGFSSTKTATIQYSDGDENARIIDPKYYFYTTSAGTSDIQVVACGTDFEPQTCGVLKTSTLKANTWYKLDDTDDIITITYLLNSTLIAKTNENNITVGSNQSLITTIDNSKPTIIVNNIKYGQSANIQLYDNQSGVSYFAVTSDTNIPSTTSSTTGNSLNTWYPTNEADPTARFTKEFPGLDAGVYYAWAKDELGNYESSRFVVDKANDVITIASVTKTYDKQNFVPNITTLSGLTTSNTYYSDSACTTQVQNPTNSGEYYVIATTSGNNNYKAETSACVKVAQIDKITIASSTTCEASKIYDGTRTATCTIGISNKIVGDNVDASTGACNYNNANVGTNKTITCTSLALSGTDSSNYQFSGTSTTTKGNIYNAKLVFNPGDGVLEGTSPLYSRKGATSVYTEIANSTAGTIPIAIKEGYTFSGWYTGNTKVINPDRSLVSDISNFTDSNGKWDLTSDQTLYAGWIASLYTITYNLDGGSATNPASYNVDTETFTLNNPTKAGYTFAGWSGTGLTGSANTTVTIPKGSTGNRTYTANYTDNIAPTYSSAEIKNVTATGYDVYVYGVTDPSGVNRVQFPTWTDSNGQDDIQSSWTTSAAAKGTLQSNGTTWVYRVNTTDHNNEAGLYHTHVYAYDALGNYNCIWTGSATVPTVTATFNGNGGGTPSPSSITKAYNNALGTLPTVSRTGYTHTGWFTASSGGTQISANTLMPATAPTYHAQWSVINYSIGYDLKGGSATNPTSYNVTSNAFTLTNPTKTGFTFTGWTGSNGSTKQTTVTIPKGSTGNRSYTANWDKYNVTYNLNRGAVTFASNQSVDTGYIIDYSKDFTLRARVNIPTNSTGRHMIFGNYNDMSVRQDFTLEFNASNQLRVWMNYDGNSAVGHAATVFTNTSIAKGVDIDVEFTWNAATKSYTFTTSGTNSNNSVTGTNTNMTGKSAYTLLMGTKDQRTGTSPYSNITVKSASYTVKYVADTTLSTLPAPANNTSENYVFHGWFQYSDGNGTIASSSTVVNNDLTYYGYWTNEVLWMSDPTISKSLVTGTGTTNTTGYEAGTTFTFTCHGASGHYPTSLQIKYNGTATSTATNNSSTTYVLTNTYTVTDYTSSASVTATCADNTGKTVNASGVTRPVYRKFRLYHNLNGATSLSGGGGKYLNTNQYLLGNSTAEGGGSPITLYNINRNRIGSEVATLGWNSSSTATSKIWSKGESVNIYYGSGTQTTGKVYANSSYNAERTIYAISYDTIPSPAMQNSNNGYFPTTGTSCGSSCGTQPSQTQTLSPYVIRVYNTRRYALSSTYSTSPAIICAQQHAIYYRHAETGEKHRLDYTFVADGFDAGRLGTYVAGYVQGIMIPLNNYSSTGWTCELLQ